MEPQRPLHPIRAFVGCLLSAGILLLCGSGCHTVDKREAWVQQWRTQNNLWRGVHLMLTTDEQAAQLVRALPQLAAVGVNVVVAEVNYAYEFHSHPELRSPNCITRARAAELARTAHANGIRLIPGFNCLGHQSWSKVTAPLLAKYPQFDETPGQYPENKDIYCRSWCPQNPDVNEVVFQLIDELADGFSADAIHVGMDEVFLIGSEFCARCKGKDPAGLFAKAANDLHRHIVGERKLEMLMWGDRLLDSQKLGYSEWESSRNRTQSAIDLLRKDIIICDWHYGKQEVYPSVPVLLDKGFRVLPSSWQPLEAAQAFSAYARQQGNPRMLGFMSTTWGRVTIPEMATWPPVSEVLKEWQ